MNKYVERLYNGIIKENPTFVLMLGMCPTLAVTSSAINGLGMGLSTTVVLILSNLLISAFRKVIPNGVRMPAYIVIVASLVTVVQFLMQAYLPSLSAALGVYIPLIVVNCIILGRAESYASKNGPVESIFDGLGMGLGFTIGLTVIGAFRELIGKGCVFNYQILGDGNLLASNSNGALKAIGDVLAYYKPITIFVLAPGAFFVLAFLIAFLNKRNAKKAAKAAAEGRDTSEFCRPEGCAGCANVLCAGKKAAGAQAETKPVEQKTEAKSVEAKPVEKNSEIKTEEKPEVKPAENKPEAREAGKDGEA